LTLSRHDAAWITSLVPDSEAIASVPIYASGNRLPRFPAGNDKSAFHADAIVGDLAYLMAKYGYMSVAQEIS
jgi:hypothetical protein